MGARGAAAQEGARLVELEGLVRDMDQEKQELQVHKVASLMSCFVLLWPVNYRFNKFVGLASQYIIRIIVYILLPGTS